MNRMLRPFVAACAMVFFAVSLDAEDTTDGTYSIVIRSEAAIDGLDVAGRQIAGTYAGSLLAVNAEDSSILVRLSGSRARMAAKDPRLSSVTAAAEPARPQAIATDAEVVPWRTGVSYEYDGAGNVKKIGSDTFFYDVASRLVQSTVNGETRKFEYDAFGNRTKCTRDTSTDCQGHTINSANNRITGTDVYDTAGNVIQLDGHQYTYDALNRMTSDTDLSSGVIREYVYTADDERIAVYTVNQWWRWTVRDTSGKVLREYMSEDADGSDGPTGPDGKGTANWQWSKDSIWRGSQLLATRQVPPGSTTPVTYHYHLDHLGTPRRITDGNDRIVGYHDYHAFGPEAGTGKIEPSLSLFKYTGHERDIMQSTVAPPLDYMHARYYSATVGRFLRPDPVISQAALRAPQLWNRYSYVVNNPLRFVDPDGRILVFSGCIENASSPACGRQLDLYLSTFGSQAGAARKFLQIGARGVVSFKGITGAAFAARFGLMGRATNYLVSNRSATFSMTTTRNALTDQHKGGYADVYSGPPGGSFGIDRGRFPTRNGYFGLLMTETEALVHEIGHAVASLIPGFARDLGLRKGKNFGMKANANFEAYATAFENAWRHEVLGAPPGDIRTGYYVDGDIYDSTSSEMFPP